MNDDKFSDLIVKAKQFNRKAFVELEHRNTVLKDLIPAIYEEKNQICEEQVTIIEVFHLRRFFDAMRKSHFQKNSEENFDKGYGYLSEALNQAERNQAWEVLVALTCNLGEYLKKRLDNSDTIIRKGMSDFKEKQLLTRKKVYLRIKECYQFAETALNRFEYFSEFIRMQMEIIIEQLTSVLFIMLREVESYRSLGEIELNKELLDLRQEIINIRDHLRKRFPLVESRSQSLNKQFNQELNNLREAITQKASEEQQQQEKLQKEMQEKQKNYKKNFSRLLAEFSESDARTKKLKKQPKSLVRNFDIEEEEYLSSSDEDEKFYPYNDSHPERPVAIRPLTLSPLFEQIALAEKYNECLNLIKAHFNLADYYRLAAAKCLKAKSIDSAIQQFELAKDVLEKCLHSIDRGIAELSDEDMAELKLLHDWVGTVLNDVSVQIEKLLRKLKRSLDCLNNSRLQAKESIINSKGLHAWFKPQAPSQDELSEKAKRRIICKEELKKTKQLSTVFKNYKNLLAIQKNQLNHEEFGGLIESNKETAECKLSVTGDRPTTYDDNHNFVPACLLSNFSLHERRLSLNSFFQLEKTEERKRKRFSFGRLNSDIKLHTGLQLTERETIILSNA